MKKFIQIILVPILFIGMLVAPSNNIAKATENENSTNIKEEETNSKTIRGRYKIVSKLANNKALSSRSNANVMIEQDHYNDILTWEFLHDSYTNTYMIKQTSTGKYLAWDKNKNNALVTTDLANSRYSYDWNMYHIKDGYHEIIPAASNYSMALDVYNSQTNDNTNVQVLRRNGGHNQQFKLVEVPNLTGTEWSIASMVDKNKVLDAEPPYGNRFNYVNIFSKNSQNNQRWILEYVARHDGYIIRNKETNLVLEMDMTQSTKKLHVDANVYEDYNPKQHWRLNQNGDGYYEIENIGYRNHVIDLEGGNTSNRNDVQGYVRNNSAAQRWMLIVP